MQLLMKAAAVVSVAGCGGGAESGLPLGNQFAKADAQQGSNVCGSQQLFSNPHPGTFFPFLESSVCLFVHASAALGDVREATPATIELPY